MSKEQSYIKEKFDQLSLSTDFSPILNSKGQAKLAFIEALASLVEKDEEEYARLQFRFLCDGVGGAQVISYTGWVYESFSRHSKLGAILKGLGVVDFPEHEKEYVKEFDFEQEFREKESLPHVSFEVILKKLEELEGVLLLGELVCENGIWHRPDPKTFKYPKNQSGEFYRTDVSNCKQN